MLAEGDIAHVQGVDVPLSDALSAPLCAALCEEHYQADISAALVGLVQPQDRVLYLGAGAGVAAAVLADLPQISRLIATEAHPDLADLAHHVFGLNGLRKASLRHGLVGASAPVLMLRDPEALSSLDPMAPGVIAQTQVPGLALNALLLELRPQLVILDPITAQQALFDAPDLTGVRQVVLLLDPARCSAPAATHLQSALAAQGFSAETGQAAEGILIMTRRADAPASPSPAAPDPQEPQVVIVTCMKNEGPFILEWIAYHKSIGIHNFVVFTNHCTDGSDLLLDRLDAMGVVTHLPNPAVMMEKTYYQPIALKYALDLPIVRRSDYFISMDVDEFISIRAGEGRFSDLLAAAGPFDALSMTELNFNSSGHWHFKDGWLTEDFTRHETATPGKWKAKRGVKTILRGLDAFERPANHRPILRPETEDDVVWLDGSGRPVPREFASDPDEKGYDCRGCYDLVSLNHHALRSVESYLIKMDRGDVVAKWRKVNRRYYRVRSRNSAADGWIQPSLPRARAVEAALLEDKPLRDLHQMCVDRHKARLAEISDDPEIVDLREWIRETYFTEAADAASEAASAPDAPDVDDTGGAGDAP